MVKTATVAELQSAQRGEIDGGIDTDFDTDSALFAEQVADEEAGYDGPMPTPSVESVAADPFVGMRIEVDPQDAWGLVQGQVRAWLDERGIIAQEDEIRAKTNELWGVAQSTDPNRATASNSTGTVVSSQGETVALGSPEGNLVVASVLRNAAGPFELPDMPSKPVAKSTLRVPSTGEFGEDDEFFISSALRDRANVLRDRHPEHFKHLDAMTVTYLWKKEGGKSKGLAVFGKCTKPSGLLKLFSESTFVIWLAADHCRAAYYGDREIEETLFHEMLHTGVAEVDENTGRGGGPTLVPHQLEIFHAEIEVYGLEAAVLREAAPLFRQAVYDALPENDPENYAENYSDPLPAEGVLIHEDGTPLTAEEIADLEAAELRDDPAEFDANGED